MLSIEQKIDLHEDLLNQLHETYTAKNHDYGDSVHDTFKKYGMTSFLVRVEDKLNRVRTLTKDGEYQAVNDEKITDSLLDAANYLILAVMELEDIKSERVRPISLGLDAISGSDIRNSSITYGKQGIETPTATKAKLSSCVMSNGKLVSYEEHEENILNEGGIHIYEHRSDTDKID